MNGQRRTSADTNLPIRPSEPSDRADRERLPELLAESRERLCRMVDMRLDRRLRGRVDASDVIQEAYLEATLRWDDYLQNPSMPFFVFQTPPKSRRQTISAQSSSATLTVSRTTHL